MKRGGQVDRVERKTVLPAALTTMVTVSLALTLLLSVTVSVAV